MHLIERKMIYKEIYDRHAFLGENKTFVRSPRCETDRFIETCIDLRNHLYVKV